VHFRSPLPIGLTHLVGNWLRERARVVFDQPPAHESVVSMYLFKDRPGAVGQAADCTPGAAVKPDHVGNEAARCATVTYGYESGVGAQRLKGLDDGAMRPRSDFTASLTCSACDDVLAV
jgi:hypothetical protein